MGFKFQNEQHKVNISFSERTRAIIEEDKINWNIDSSSSFINTVFENYKNSATSSISNTLEKERSELISSLNNDCITNNTINSIVDSIMSKRRKVLQQYIKEHQTKDGIAQQYYVNASNYKYLISNQCDEEKYYSNRPGKYIRAVIEEYCTLPFIRREEIFHSVYYKKINNAIKNSTRIIITNNQEQTFYVEPYKIIPDILHTRNYLVCYSGRNYDGSDSIIASYSISNIMSIEDDSKAYNMTPERITNIEMQLQTNSPTYLIGEHELIKVRLTENGKSTYRTKLYNRPHKIEELSTENEYVFDCTHLQAFHYFFSLGKEAEILSPDTLRNKFKKAFECSLELYTNT